MSHDEPPPHESCRVHRRRRTSLLPEARLLPGPSRRRAPALRRRRLGFDDAQHVVHGGRDLVRRRQGAPFLHLQYKERELVRLAHLRQPPRAATRTVAGTVVTCKLLHRGGSPRHSLVKKKIFDRVRFIRDTHSDETAQEKRRQEQSTQSLKPLLLIWPVSIDISFLAYLVPKYMTKMCTFSLLCFSFNFCSVPCGIRSGVEEACQVQIATAKAANTSR
jgi:hypothetical protein